MKNMERKEQWVVRLRLVEGGVRYGQNRSKTFDYSPFVTALTCAKRFDSVEQGMRWCKRMNIDALFNGPQPFLDRYDVVNVDKAYREAYIGTEHVSIGSVTLKTIKQSEL